MQTQATAPLWGFSRTRFNLYLALACIWASPVYAQDQAEDFSPKPEKLFASNETFNISIKAPWRTIVRKNEVQDPYPASMQFTDSLGQAQDIPVTVERRGITRQAVCKYPPIKLRYNKEDVNGTTFRGTDELKLVTHCEKGDRWEQYYVKEYLAYRFFNQITEKSYRARPLSITYIESENDSADGPRFGFLIEDTADLAKRNNLKKLDIARTQPAKLDQVQAARVALFEYLIANVDFELLSGPKDDKCCHNARLIADDSGKNIVAVPYDFDSSGFVDAHYAAPNEFLGIKSVTQRLYRGFCTHNSQMEVIRQEYIAKEADIMGLINAETRLSWRSVKNANKFIGKFYETIKSDKGFQKEIIGKCRK